MSVSTTNGRVRYAGNSSTSTPYPTGFRFDDASWLQVWLTDADGVVTRLVLGADYTVSGAGAADGGSITTLTAYGADHTLTILRRTPLTQLLDLAYNDRLPAALVEAALDQLTFGVQEVSERLGSALRFPDAEAQDASMILPPVAERAGKVQGYHETTGLPRLFTLPLTALETQPPASGYARVLAVAGDVTWQAVDVINVRDYGATGDGTTDDTAALQAAIDAAAATCRCHIPAGTYKISATLRIPSKSYLYGDGAETTIIRMASTVGRNTTCMQTGTRNAKREHIVLEHFTIDANDSRWAVSGGTVETVSGETLDTNGCALCISYSEYVVARHLRLLDAYKHCLDVQAPVYATNELAATAIQQGETYRIVLVGTTDFVAFGAFSNTVGTSFVASMDGTPASGTGMVSDGVMYYDPQPSRYVWVEDCYLRGGGDDNLTTHHSSDIWITRCVSEHPSGARTPANSNCYEVDDGSRNIHVSDCVAIGGICGLQVKGHEYAPAPYNVVVNGFRAINNTIGIEARHTNYYGGAADEDGYTTDVLETGRPIRYAGASPTARNLTLSNIEVIAPRNVTNEGGTYDALHAIRIRSYENVILANVRVSEGELDAAGDYGAASTLDGHENAVIRIYGGAARILANNVAIYGFSGSIRGLSCTSSFKGELMLDGFLSIDGPQYPIRMSAGTATYDATISNYAIFGDYSAEPAIYATAPKVRVGNGYQTGYDRNTNASVLGPEFRRLSLRRKAVSTGGSPDVPQEALTMTWYEGVQDLGQYEGLKISWKAQLVADTTEKEIGNVGFRKVNGTDTSRLSNFFVQVSIDGNAAPVDALEIDAARRATLLQLLNLASGKAPATASSAGTAGDVAWDSGFLYVCTATNTWKRAALSTW